MKNIYRRIVPPYLRPHSLNHFKERRYHCNAG